MAQGKGVSTKSAGRGIVIGQNCWRHIFEKCILGTQEYEVATLTF